MILTGSICLIHIYPVCKFNCSREHVGNNFVHFTTASDLSSFLGCCCSEAHTFCDSDSHSFVFLLQVKSLVFDQSGTYLAVGGSDIRVYICKQWSEVLNFTGEWKKCLVSSLHFT